jgi:hypothetical protein
MSFITRKFTTVEIRDGEERRVLVCETPLALSDLVADYDAAKFNALVDEARSLMEKTGHDSATVRNERDA